MTSKQEKAKQEQGYTKELKKCSNCKHFEFDVDKHFRSRLMEFAKESNRIEGITNSEANERMFNKLEAFLKIEYLQLSDIFEFNEYGVFRDKLGMDVRVGDYYPPKGRKNLIEEVRLLLDFINEKKYDAIQAHHIFESIHLFTDGNGRVGRAIWLWQMVRQHNYDLSRGFLWEWYYQSLRGW